MDDPAASPCVTVFDVRRKFAMFTLDRPRMRLTIFRPYRTPQVRSWNMTEKNYTRFLRWNRRRVQVILALQKAGRPMFPEVRLASLPN